MNGTPPWLKSLLEEHFEEVSLLWELRQMAMVDADYCVDDLVELDRRLEAHVDGLVLGGEHALPVLTEGLAGDEASVVFAATYVLMRIKTPLANGLVVQAISAAAQNQIDGHCQALRQMPLDSIADQLRQSYDSGPVAAAAIAAESFAASGRVARAPSRLADFYHDQDPGVRRAAWRITALLDLE